jgi:hypothetical protein
LGFGFYENVYENAMIIELQKEGIYQSIYHKQLLEEEIEEL